MSLNLSRKQKAMVLILLDSFFIFVSALSQRLLKSDYIRHAGIIRPVSGFVKIILSRKTNDTGGYRVEK